MVGTDRRRHRDKRRLSHVQLCDAILTHAICSRDVVHGANLSQNVLVFMAQFLVPKRHIPAQLR